MESVWQRNGEAQMERLARECGQWQYRAERERADVIRLEAQVIELKGQVAELLRIVEEAIGPLEAVMQALERHDETIPGLSGVLADMQAMFS